MLYPNIINKKKKKPETKGTLILAILIIILLVLIKYVKNENIIYCFAGVLGIVYIYITTELILNKPANIARYIVTQTIFILVVMIYISQNLYNKNWAISMAMPIILIVSNLSILLVFVKGKINPISHIIKQLIIMCVTIGLYIYYGKYIEDKFLIYITYGTSMLNFILLFISARKGLRENIKKNLHI